MLDEVSSSIHALHTPTYLICVRVSPLASRSHPRQGVAPWGYSAWDWRFALVARHRHPSLFYSLDVEPPLDLNDVPSTNLWIKSNLALWKKVLKEVSVIECLYICGCLHARQATACRNKTATHFSHSHNAAQPMVNTVHVEIAITSIVIIEEWKALKCKPSAHCDAHT